MKTPHQELKMNGRVLNIVVSSEALVQKHKDISIYNAD